MSLKAAFQMDHVSGINIAGDTTFALMLEAQARGHSLFPTRRNGFPCATASWKPASKRSGWPT